MLEKATLFCLLFAFATTPCFAQQESDAPAKQFVLEPGDLEIRALIDRAAEFLGWNVLVNETELQHSNPGGQGFKLQNRVVTGVDGCEDLMTTMLATKGFGVRSLSNGENLYEVIALNGPRARELFASPPQKTVEQVLARPNLRMPVTTVVQLQHINAVVATNALRPFFASGGGPTAGLTIGNVGAVASVLLSGMQDQVANAIGMLREADVPPPIGTKPGLEERIEGLEQRIAALEKAIAELKGK